MSLPVQYSTECELLDDGVNASSAMVSVED